MEFRTVHELAAAAQADPALQARLRTDPAGTLNDVAADPPTENTTGAAATGAAVAISAATVRPAVLAR